MKRVQEHKNSQRNYEFLIASINVIPANEELHAE
jgi:hypothetical protein